MPPIVFSILKRVNSISTGGFYSQFPPNLVLFLKFNIELGEKFKF